jgi:tetratricopeptide (TPR) repeat protein
MKKSTFSKYRITIFLLAIVAIAITIVFYLAPEPKMQTIDTTSTSIVSPPETSPLVAVSPPGSVLTPPPATAPIQKDVQKMFVFQSRYEIGRQLYEGGNNEAAMRIFSDILAEFPNSAIVYDARGTVYTALNDYENALSDYSKAIELDQSFAQAYYNRGRVYSFLNKHDKALADLKQTVELAPHEFGYRAQGNIGLIYQKQGEYDKAIEAFEASMAYDDSNADVFYFRGEIHTILENYEAAIADYQAAIERFSRYDLAYQSLGYAYYKTGQLETASEALNQALEISPDSPAAHFYLMMVYLATDDIDNAKEEASQATSVITALSEEEQRFILTRILADLEAFAQKNPAKAKEVESLVNLIPNPN